MPCCSPSVIPPPGPNQSVMGVGQYIPSFSLPPHGRPVYVQHTCALERSPPRHSPVRTRLPPSLRRRSLRPRSPCALSPSLPSLPSSPVSQRALLLLPKPCLPAPNSSKSIPLRALLTQVIVFSRSNLPSRLRPRPALSAPGPPSPGPTSPAATLRASTPC